LAVSRKVLFFSADFFMSVIKELCITAEKWFAAAQ